jgi:hypothetical protein
MMGEESSLTSTLLQTFDTVCPRPSLELESTLNRLCSQGSADFWLDSTTIKDGYVNYDPLKSSVRPRPSRNISQILTV